MIAGHKITHRHFTPSEYLWLKSGQVFTEEGYKMPLTTYNPWSADAAPDGWEIWKPENEEE